MATNLRLRAEWPKSSQPCLWAPQACLVGFTHLLAFDFWLRSKSLSLKTHTLSLSLPPITSLSHSHLSSSKLHKPHSFPFPFPSFPFPRQLHFPGGIKKKENKEGILWSSIAEYLLFILKKKKKISFSLSLSLCVGVGIWVFEERVLFIERKKERKKKEERN